MMHKKVCPNDPGAAKNGRKKDNDEGGIDAEIPENLEFPQHDHGHEHRYT
jgi:hypothetical protein